MTYKVQISSNLAQSLQGLQSDVGGMGDLGSLLSGLINQASALQSSGVGLPGLNSLGSMISSTAAQIGSAQAGTSAAPFANTIAALGSQMASSNMTGMSSLITSMQSQLTSLLTALDPTGQLAKILHLVQLDNAQGIMSSAFQGQHKTTWDQNGVTHTSSSKVSSQAPQLPHNGLTLVSDALQVTKQITGQSFGMLSDEKLKTKIADLGSVLEKVLALKVKTFDVASFDFETGEVLPDEPIPSLGLIAQDLQRVFPQLVRDGKFLSIDVDKMVMVLLAAFVEFAAATRIEIEEIREHIAELS